MAFLLVLFLFLGVQARRGRALVRSGRRICPRCFPDQYDLYFLARCVEDLVTGKAT
jgi:hypothetical protein